MKHLLVCLSMLFCAVAVRAQVTLEQCKVWARDNYPVIKQYDLVEQGRRLTVANAAKAWLPQVGVSGSATYQSDVTAIPITLPDIDIPTIGKDQYDVTITINQQIYDGGTVASAKRMAEAQGDVDRRKVGVTMYDVNRRIDELFFGILMLDEQIAQIAVLQEDLSLSLASVEAMVRGGVANQTDVDAVQVELVKARQRGTSLLTQRNTYRRMLETFTGVDFGDSVTFVKPSPDYDVMAANRRPELALYAAQDRLLDTPERDAFLFNTRLQTEFRSGVIDDLKEQIRQDDEIIKLRRRIREKAEKRVANGTETVNEMLRDINAVIDAEVGKRLHEVQLLHEIYKVKHLNNF